MIIIENRCTSSGYSLFMAGGSIHLTKAPRSHTAPLSYCPECLGHFTLRHELPDLPSEAIARAGDGYSWMDELKGWIVLSSWGSDGYDLGDWPLQILAVCRTRCEYGTREGYGMLTYCEGDTTVTAYETRAALHDSVSRYAFGVWTMTENGPDNLPATYEELPDALKMPSRH